MHRLTPTLLALLCLAPLTARAHGDLHEQIRAVTARIEQEPNNAVLVHKRGELHRAHGEYRAAFADYDRAQRLDPELHVVQLSRGRSLLETHRPAAALRCLTRFLQLEPAHAEALLLRARAQVALGKRAAAEADYANAQVANPDPPPELVLERASNLAAAAHGEEALAVLNEAALHLPGVITLQLAALDLETKLRQFDLALARVERLLGEAQRKESWLARKAEILERAGRSDEAEAVRQAALAAIEHLPADKRELASTRALARELSHHHSK